MTNPRLLSLHMADLELGYTIIVSLENTLIQGVTKKESVVTETQ